MAKANRNVRKVGKVALFGTYFPRLCGIATFTKDLRDALSRFIGPENAVVLAMDEESSSLDYPSDVQFQVSAHKQIDYQTAADLLNINQIDVTIIQHEFGIYGGAEGVLILNLLRSLRMPIICTLHTVLKEPSKIQARIIREMGNLSDRLVVMSQLGMEYLKDIYDIPPHKISFVPHGIPDVPFVDPSFHKDQFGLEGHTTLLTFGLLSPGKGIEVMLNALPGVIKRHPDVKYVILGATHPHVLRNEGNAYRTSLGLWVDNNGLHDHVVFQNRFVSLEELCGYIGAADLYITPYPNVAQITSGTLAYAMGAGKAVISTPYWYAEEMLAADRGRLFPFQDSEALCEQVNDLLDNHRERNAMRKRAYLHCRPMIWEKVARRYLDIAAEVIEERRNSPRLIIAPKTFVLPDAIPEIDLRHLRTMTDDTGIYQHAIYTVPDRNHGYCTDDNARALIAVLRYYSLLKDDSVLPLVTTYLAFVQGAFNRGTKRFRNFMSYDRNWHEEMGSEDSHCRTLWALGETVALAPNDGVLGYATRLFNDALPTVGTFTSPRAWAFTLVGIHAYLQRFGGDSQVRRVRDLLSQKLYALFEKMATGDWPWCEDLVTYDNAKLSHALILCGQWVPDEDMLEKGVRSLEWLLDIQTNRDGNVRLIGCNGWHRQGDEPALFDQQPLEIMSLVDACAEAYRYTGEQRWGDEIRRLLGWFLGKNDLNVCLYDYKTGGCRDGLNPQGANQNEGAESTLSWLISLITVHDLAAMAKTIAEWKNNE
ncbi:glycosyltransferase [bacterium]|nr:glycosyltransferase [bacterium]